MKFYYLLLLFVITACGSGTEAVTEENVQNPQTETGEAISDVDESTLEASTSELETDGDDPDSLDVPSFTINFDFSEKVQALLTSGKEGLVVDLVLSGTPADNSKLMGKDYYSDEDQEVYLKNIEIVYQQNESQTFTIENLKISKEALNALDNPNYTIGLNFYSSRTSSDNNLFSANALIEEVNTMKSKTHTVKVEML